MNLESLFGRRRALSFLLACCLVLVLPHSPHFPLLAGEPVHPETRQAASPADEETANVNPPALLWPAVRGRDVRYSVRLVHGADVSAGATFAANDLRWALFNPHAKLAPGKWKWQYAVVRQPDGSPNWSEWFRFRVDDSARDFVTPPAQRLLAGVPNSHPRILATREELGPLRNGLRGTPEWDSIVDRAERYLHTSLPDPSQATPNQRGEDEFQAKRFARWASKGFAAKAQRAVTELSMAYLLTGDEQFGREAVRRAVFVARLDPDGATSRTVSDFADGSCMRAMALAYDSCFGLLTDEERTVLRQAMHQRAKQFFDRHINSLETRVFNAHVWQHILAEAAEVAFALLGEEPDAETWLWYVYEVWTSRFPTLGGNDGGWANGANYFGTNMETLLVLPEQLGRCAGANLYDQPWFRNVSKYQMYCWPPRSASDGFGDGAEREVHPPATRGYFVETMARKFDDPYAAWYAGEVLGEDRVFSRLPPRMGWHRLRYASEKAIPDARPPTDLPQARCFRDIGLAAMHTNLDAAAQNLMVALRSSPFGSFNHMHACQNSFNILFGGERVFANSGYYIAYGDEHFTGWYKHSRGHNTVLIDGRGQTFGSAGYGWIARFLHGRGISYCLGDASRAYGDAGLTRFRRHLVLLRPATVVVYDDLAADHDADWSWLLHSKDKMTADVKHQNLQIESGAARARVDVFASSDLTISVDNQFHPPAVNWRKKTSGGEVIEYPNQWHATVAPREKCQTVRLLAVIQVAPNDVALPTASSVVQSGGSVTVNDWQIAAQLDASRPASLIVQSRDGKSVLAADVKDARMIKGLQQFPLELPPAVLVEQEAGIEVNCKEDWAAR